MLKALLLIAALALLGGCGSSSKSSSSSGPSTAPPASAGVSSGSSATPSGTAVAIKNYKYAPEAIKVKVGGSIKFTNQDPAPHTAQPDNGSAFDTGTLNQGKSAAVTFKTPGTFAYHCAFHAFMHGTVIVTSA